MTFERIKKRWKALFRSEELERELDAELRFHLESDTAQNLRNGTILARITSRYGDVYFRARASSRDCSALVNTMQ